MNILKKKFHKSMKIISILSEFKDISKSRVLDIGCGKGLIAKTLKKYCKELIAIDIEDKRLIKGDYKFILVKDENLPFEDNYFDIVISNQVIEHVDNQDLHIKEIFRVLNNKGICYLATPNKYWFIEPHYYLPFLGMLPAKIADIYLKFFKNKCYNIKLLSYDQLINKLEKYFIINDFTIKVIKNPNKYHLEKLYRLIPSFISNLTLIYHVVPSFILILEKRN